MSDLSTASIWFVTPVIDALNELNRHSAIEHLGIQFSAVGPDWLEATMPVDSRTVQPMGILHGGISVALAETLGSTAANCCVDSSRFRAVGVEVNANHMRMARSGLVTGTTRPLSLGRRLHVWQTQILDSAGLLLCASRLTLAIIGATAAIGRAVP